MFKLLLKLSTISLILALSTACGKSDLASSNPMQNTPVPQQYHPVALYGTWGSDQPFAADSGLEIYFSLRFDLNSVTGIANCINPTTQEKVTVEASAPATITDKNITITGNASKTVSLNGFKCSANVVEGSMNYIINEFELSLSETSSNRVFKLKHIESR